MQERKSSLNKHPGKNNRGGGCNITRPEYLLNDCRYRVVEWQGGEDLSFGNFYRGNRVYEKKGAEGMLYLICRLKLINNN